jgi:protein TonB
VVTFASKEDRRAVAVPFAAFVHTLGVALLLAISFFSPVELLRPPAVMVFLNPAPPPPPPPLKGSPLLSTPDKDEPPKPQETPDPDKKLEFLDRTTPLEIPDEILKPRTELQFGIETGLEQGDIQGMEGGVLGGVVGGVPGGIIGGVIGGTGTDVFPQPDIGPVPLRQPRPNYTVEAIRKKISGVVTLFVVIDVQGKVRVLKVLRSIPELDGQAIEVVEAGWLFKPALKNGRPIASLAELQVAFNLY